MIKKRMLSSIKEIANMLIICACLAVAEDCRAQMPYGMIPYNLLPNVAAERAAKQFNNYMNNHAWDNYNSRNSRNMDYLLDPNYAKQQVDQQLYQEYLQTTNGGKTMTYDEWMTARANAWSKVQEEERGPSRSSSSSSGHQCRVCGGTGQVVKETYLGNSSSTKWCSICNKNVYTGHRHQQCSTCGGSGYVSY